MQSSKTRNANNKRKIPSKKEHLRKPFSNASVTVNKAPVSKNVRTKKPSPKITSVGGDIIVTNKEYIGDVTSANAGYLINSFNVNPGLSGTFPWLSAIANRFESYLFSDLRFIYEPICATSVPGSVMMAIDYDASDSAPSNKVSIMSYKGATRTSPWDRADYNARSIDLRKFGVQRYVRSAVVSGDIKTYDVGNLFVATQNTPATASTLGELYVQYTVRLYTPQTASGASSYNQPSTEAASQWSTIKIPAGIALPSLLAEYRGSGASPLAWLDPDNTGARVTMFLNLNNLQNFLFSIRTSSANWPAGGDPLRMFNNLKWDGTSTIPGSTMLTTAKVLTKGFLEQNSIGSFCRTYLIQNKSLRGSASSTAGVLPIQFIRLDAEYQIEVAIIPVQANYTGANTTIGTTGTDWAFPPVYIPTWTATGARSDGSKTLVDEVNTIRRPGPDDDGVEPETPITRSQSKSKFKW
nr:MAG: hypothetical protein 2 [Beijing sediment noda-like virus 1]